MNLRNKLNYFLRLANEFESEPSTERGMPSMPVESVSGFDTDESGDLKLQAYEFIQFAHRLATLKNLMNKLRFENPAYNIMFGVLSPMRPGTIGNSIRSMIENDVFDSDDYLSIKDSFFEELNEKNMLTKITNLAKFVNVDLLNDKNKADLQTVLKLIHLLRPVLANGLSFVG